jgi:hypothetical protein
METAAACQTRDLARHNVDGEVKCREECRRSCGHGSPPVEDLVAVDVRCVGSSKAAGPPHGAAAACHHRTTAAKAAAMPKRSRIQVRDLIGVVTKSYGSVVRPE